MASSSSGNSGKRRALPDNPDLSPAPKRDFRNGMRNNVSASKNIHKWGYKLYTKKDFGSEEAGEAFASAVNDMLYMPGEHGFKRAKTAEEMKDG